MEHERSGKASRPEIHADAVGLRHCRRSAEIRRHETREKSLGLKEAHRDLKISPAEFDAVAGELARSLDHFNVPEREKQEVLAAFAAHMGEVTEGYAQ